VVWPLSHIWSDLRAGVGKPPDIVFAKVDTEAEQVAGAFGVMSIPTVMVVRDRVVLYSQPGAIPADALEDLISQVREIDMDEVRRQLAERRARTGLMIGRRRRGSPPTPATTVGVGRLLLAAPPVRQAISGPVPHPCEWGRSCTMDHMASYRGRLLVATPVIGDANFDRTVVLLLEHGDDGALGSSWTAHGCRARSLPEWNGLAAQPSVVSVGGLVEQGIHRFGRLRWGLQPKGVCCRGIGTLDLSRICLTSRRASSRYGVRVTQDGDRNNSKEIGRRRG
jgi:hypothetical protein